MSSSKVRIEGTVAPGYDSVKKMFETNVHRGVEENAQLCVYVAGEKVVDLWGTSVGNDKYDAETMQIVFRTIDKLYTWKDFHTENIKKNSVGKAIEEDEFHYPPSAYNTKREYHAISRGWVLNEIFRRVEPKGRTIGEFLREDICEPLGVKAYAGVKEEELGNFADLTTWDGKNILLQCSLPYFMGSKSEISLTDFAPMIMKAMFSKKKPLTEEEKAAKDTRKKRPKIQIEGVEGGLASMRVLATEFNSRDCRMGENPSVGTSCIARGLAKIAACIVGGGEIEGVRFLGPETVEAMQAEVKTAGDFGMGEIKTSFTQGGVNKFMNYPEDSASDLQKKSYRDGWIGWMGLGGSVMQWEPELKIGFGFTPSLLHFYDFSNRRAAKIQHEVKMCAMKLKEQSKM